MSRAPAPVPPTLTGRSAPESVEAAMTLLAAAGESLTAASRADSGPERVERTRVGVLRAAAAVLAARAGARRGDRPTPVWSLLPRIAPELTEWAELFEHTLDPARAPRVWGIRAVDDLLRDGHSFVEAVARSLGLPPVLLTIDLVDLTGHRAQVARPAL